MEERAEERQAQQKTELPTNEVVVRQGSAEAQEKADSFRQQQTYYDQPEPRSSKAINAYQSFAREDKRVEIQQMMGVDTYV